ncbi:formin-like protein 3 [Xenopus laevis]|uniref:Formin-like protein 3 n=1 Tax=Xenopus laevis TaxID=8355 RepID=A0A8J1KNX7_XENLA|nr:formin-like protein 3 [Xenopus laevis]
MVQSLASPAPNFPSSSPSVPTCSVPPSLPCTSLPPLSAAPSPAPNCTSASPLLLLCYGALIWPPLPQTSPPLPSQPLPLLYVPPSSPLSVPPFPAPNCPSASPLLLLCYDALARTREWWDYPSGFPRVPVQLCRAMLSALNCSCMPALIPQNSPNELQMMSDAPAHHLFCLLPPVPPTQNSLPEVLAVVQVCLEGEISQQSILSRLSRGKKASGDLIPERVGCH